MPTRVQTRAGGRPPKFDEPRRPVTMTLPERTLGQLAAIDDDRASAIVKLVDSALPSTERRRAKPVEVVEVAPGVAIIVVTASRFLRRIPWLRLAEVAKGRYLLTVVPGTAIESLEVALLDLVEGLPASEAYERGLLSELREVIAASRRERNIIKFEMLYVRPTGVRRRRSSVDPFTPRPPERSRVG